MARQSDGGTGRPYGGLTPEERRADRRRRLLDAAFELYGDSGYHATSVAQLCRAAKVAPGKFYEEFASTEELLIELCASIWEPVRARILADVAAAAPDVIDMTRAAVAAYCHGMLDDTRRAHILAVEFPGSSLAAEAVRREQTLQFARLSLAGFQAIVGESDMLSDHQVAMLATALVGAVQEAVRFWLLEPEPRPPVDDVVETLMTMYVAVGAHLTTAADARPG